MYVNTCVSLRQACMMGPAAGHCGRDQGNRPRRLYEEQSPIFHVQNIKTPFMILQGTDDGAVDYVEGLQFFNAARRNGKQVILLSYPGEAHNLANRDNQKDFTIRMKQFFDHYLMDKPAPQWMTDGLPQVKKGSPIK
jgi:dipeptidyl aminopeptidase/acylaminoacyl peptidase